LPAFSSRFLSVLEGTLARDAKASRTAPVPQPFSGGDTKLLLESEENGNGRKRSLHAD
jgi:hypothetical protein